MGKSRFYIGTAGWSYQDWEGIVYPRRKGADFHPLAFLAEFINFMEVNSTFYRTPVQRMTQSWVKRIQSRPDFLFSVKLHQDFTHGERRITPKMIDEFKWGIEPLRIQERLAAILVQFPWSFKDSGRSRAHLERVFAAFADYPLALEVRHGSWDKHDFFQWLQGLRIAFCNIDQPQINHSLGPTAIQTHPDFAYVRLHGRNTRDWFNPSVGRDARYNYLYSTKELDSWVERIKDLGKTSPNVFIVTNNHYQGQAVANAVQIKNKLTGEKIDLPLGLLQQYPILREIVKRIEKGQMDLFDQ